MLWDQIRPYHKTLVCGDENHSGKRTQCTDQNFENDFKLSKRDDNENI